MSKRLPNWVPIYSISPRIARALMQIEAAKSDVAHIRLSPGMEAELRHKARVKSTHYSTQIEGNRLTLKEAQDIIERKKTNFHGRERDVNEVRNYWDAVLKVEEWAAQKIELSEDLIQKLHALVERGKRAKATPYRDGQNVIRDAISGGIVYLPPEAKDVPILMKQLVSWVHSAIKEKMPIPIVVALLHYQFVTIHPYFDGNGRTGRLLVTFLLQRDGYGLDGFFSMEEQHARDLQKYYDSLSVHTHHNYYFGRVEADLTAWIEYFITSLAEVFENVRDEASQLVGKEILQEPSELRSLDRRARIVLALFAKKDKISSQDVAMSLGLSSRMARNLIAKWVDDGLLIVIDTSNRARSYRLSEKYRKFIGN